MRQNPWHLEDPLGLMSLYPAHLIWCGFIYHYKAMIDANRVERYIRQVNDATEVNELPLNHRNLQELTLNNPYESFSYVILRFSGKWLSSFTTVRYSGKTTHYLT